MQPVDADLGVALSCGNSDTSVSAMLSNNCTQSTAECLLGVLSHVVFIRAFVILLLVSGQLCSRCCAVWGQAATGACGSTSTSKLCRLQARPTSSLYHAPCAALHVLGAAPRRLLFSPKHFSVACLLVGAACGGGGPVLLGLPAHDVCWSWPCVCAVVYRDIAGLLTSRRGLFCPGLCALAQSEHLCFVLPAGCQCHGSIFPSCVFEGVSGGPGPGLFSSLPALVSHVAARQQACMAVSTHPHQGQPAPSGQQSGT